jgi:AbrB family looped-hinge helix DNA binding protein
MGPDKIICLPVMEISYCESKQTLSGYKSHEAKILFKNQRPAAEPDPFQGPFSEPQLCWWSLIYLEVLVEKTRLSNKGQIVIPKQVRAAHGWEPGLEFSVEDMGDSIKLKPIKPYAETKIGDVLGCVNYNGPKKSLKEMEAAIAQGVRKKK